MKVLVAEDNEPYRIATVRECKKQGLEVSTAVNGIEAIEKLSQNKYDVAVLDYSMPGKTGLDVVDFIKKEMPDLPILMVSATNVPAANVGLKLGVDLFLMKGDIDIKALPGFIKSIGVLGKYGN